jgi:FtsZ-binding cell division protein ZapB
MDIAVTLIEHKLGIFRTKRANGARRVADIQMSIAALQASLDARLVEIDRLNDTQTALRQEGDELRERAAQWQQLCDLLGLARATHPHYVADELKEMRDALTYIAQRSSAMTGTPTGSRMDERRIWQDMGKRAMKAVNWLSREADLGTEGDPPFCGYCHTRHYGYQDHYGA